MEFRKTQIYVCSHYVALKRVEIFILDSTMQCNMRYNERIQEQTIYLYFRIVKFSKNRGEKNLNRNARIEKRTFQPFAKIRGKGKSETTSRRFGRSLTRRK